MAKWGRRREVKVSMTTQKWLEKEAKWTSVTPVSMTTHWQLMGKVGAFMYIEW